MCDISDDWKHKKMIDTTDTSDDRINEMKSKISHNSQNILWAEHRFDPSVFAFRDIPEILEHAWRDLEYLAAKNIFSMINDGELYCLRVKPFERNLDLAKGLSSADFRETMYSAFPEISTGYKGSLSKVRVEPWRVMETPSWGRLPLESLPLPPTWGGIASDIRRRLKADARLDNLVRQFVKNILARVLWLPEDNPKHWGMNKF